eukprot:6200305-Pleurochrysis_carterae.AAC.2
MPFKVIPNAFRCDAKTHVATYSEHALASDYSMSGLPGLVAERAATSFGVKWNIVFYLPYPSV